MKQLVVVLVAVCAVACGGKKEDPPATKPVVETKPEPPKPVDPPKPTAVEKAGSGAGPATPNVADAPAGNPPPDGKYEKVMVEGVTVPMVNVMEGGSVVLVDTDGKKPRTWEEQYKKKSAKLAGQLDIHKTDANKNGKFDDDAIDKEGIWLLDVKGNITKH
ncbi:MAG: hypothetical protein ABI867_04865 [Kofleriaceae bacterium]